MHQQDYHFHQKQEFKHIFKPLSQLQMSLVEQKGFNFLADSFAFFQIYSGISVVLTLCGKELLLQSHYHFVNGDKNHVWSCLLGYDTRIKILQVEEKQVKSSVTGFLLICQGYQLKFSYPKPIQYCSSKWLHQFTEKVNIIGFQKYFRPIKIIKRQQISTSYKVLDCRLCLYRTVQAFPRASIEADDEKKSEFKKYIQILRSVSRHPNIMKIKGVYQSQNTIYLVTQHLQGGNLKDRIQELSYKDLKSIIFWLIQTLYYLSLQNISHGCICLQNIQFKNLNSSEPVLTGFNEKNFTILSKLQSIFKAPEILKGIGEGNQLKNLTQKADVFSIGVIFYMLLTKKQPHFVPQDQLEPQNQNPITISINDLQNVQQNIQEKQNALELLNKMLSYDPSNRINLTDALGHKYFCQIFEDAQIEINPIQQIK